MSPERMNSVGTVSTAIATIVVFAGVAIKVLHPDLFSEEFDGQRVNVATSKADIELDSQKVRDLVECILENEDLDLGKSALSVELVDGLIQTFAVEIRDACPGSVLSYYACYSYNRGFEISCEHSEGKVYVCTYPGKITVDGCDVYGSDESLEGSVELNIGAK